MLSWIAEKVTDAAKYVLGIHELDLLADQDSVTEPGNKSIMSSSLDEVEPKITSEQLFAELEQSLRWPIDPLTEYVLKSCDVTENGPDEFVVKVIVDGVKLDSWGKGRGDGCDRVKTWKKVVLDRKALKVQTWDYVPEVTMGAWADEATDKEAVASFTLCFLAEPPRFECWLTKDGERITNADFANFLHGWTDPLVKSLRQQMSAKVKVAKGPSPRDASLESVVSEPMDEFIDYDTYFESMVSKTRDFFSKVPDTEIEDINEREFLVKTTVKDSDGKESIHPKRVKHNQETGELSIVFESPAGDGTVKHQGYRVLHQSPLRLEAWEIDEEGKRFLSHSLLKRVGLEVYDTVG